MADDSSGNKVTLELDLDTKEFSLKIGDVVQKLQGAGAQGTSSFSEFSIAVTGVNQALELGQKALELWEKSLQNLGDVEKIKNQETALKNLTATLGIDADNLIAAVEKASKGTVTHAQAAEASFKLLNAGVKAESIPTLIEWAQKLEASGTRNVTFAQTIDAVSTSVETGAVRMRAFGIANQKFGDHLQVQNAILKEAKSNMAALGDGFEDSAKRIEARQAEWAQKIKNEWASLTKGVALTIWGDSIDKATSKLKSAETQLQQLDEYEKKNADTIKNLSSEQLRVQQDRARYQKVIAQATEELASASKKEAAATEEVNSKVTQEVEIKKALTQFQVQQIDLQARAIVASRNAAAEEAEDGTASVRRYQEVSSAKKAIIEKDFSDQKMLIQSQEKDETLLRSKLVQLEIEKSAKLRAIRVEDEQFMISQSNAERAVIEKNIVGADQAQQRHQQLQINQENKLFSARLEKMRTEGLSKSQFDKKMEQEEDAHQKRLSGIKDSYTKVNMRNFQMGLNQSLGQMKTQFGSFTNFVASATTKTHGIMSKGFVDLAKGHGDAMQAMTSQFLEMIGTQMIESGVFHMLAGAASFDPVEAGLGVALVAAGSAITSVSAANAPSSSGGGGGGFGTLAPDGGSSSPTNPSAPSTAPGKNAQIIINGDFLNSRETANHLADILRQNSDITDYAIVAQGKNYGV